MLRRSCYLSLLAAFPAVAGSPGQPLDHAYSLKNADPFPLEREYHAIAFGSRRQSFLFPDACPPGGGPGCREAGLWAYRDSGGTSRVFLSPIAGLESRYGEGGMLATDFGLLATGGAGAASFYLDARMAVEEHSRPVFPSPDREPIDRQDAAQAGGVVYASFSRYRSDFSYAWSWGRVSLAHDAVHWGPGLYGNLVFQEDAVPFDHLACTIRLGPFTVQSLYGRLLPEGNRTFDTVPDTRSVYAHRYEWTPVPSLLLGLSEQLILYNHEQPFAAVPLVPLFMDKGDGWERLNNGNLAADASWRFAERFRAYTEFLIDDVISPASLFDDQWGNKWGWLAGLHWAWGTPAGPAGVILEYARLEPWAYTHYAPNTAQAANLGYPLGDPDGPNSQSLTGKLYARREGAWYLGVKAKLAWKGDDPGSHIEDAHPDSLATKSFLAGDPEPRATVTPIAEWIHGWWSVSASWTFADSMEGAARLQFSLP